MTDQAAFAHSIVDPIITALEQMTTESIDVYADCPRRPDGQIADPYDRGCLDGIITITTNFRAGFVAALAQYLTGDQA